MVLGDQSYLSRDLHSSQVLGNSDDFGEGYPDSQLLVDGMDTCKHEQLPTQSHQNGTHDLSQQKHVHKL